MREGDTATPKPETTGVPSGATALMLGKQLAHELNVM